jgi:hypothetical protein
MPQPLRIECSRYHALSRGSSEGIVSDHYDRERFVATLGEAAHADAGEEPGLPARSENDALVFSACKVWRTVGAHAKTSAARVRDDC